MTTFSSNPHLAVSWWGNIGELREVLALVESRRLTPMPLELAKINDVCERVKRGPVASRVMITP